MQCTARSKRTGERCKRHARPGCSVCHYHGAGGGRPFAHGRRSKHLIIRMAARQADGKPALPVRHSRQRLKAALERLQAAGLLPEE